MKKEHRQLQDQILNVFEEANQKYQAAWSEISNLEWVKTFTPENVTFTPKKEGLLMEFRGEAHYRLAAQSVVYNPFTDKYASTSKNFRGQLFEALRDMFPTLDVEDMTNSSTLFSFD